MHNDYTTVTELPGMKASKEQAARLYQRYHFASRFCAGKDVLEIACGAGQGLGYLAKIANSIFGGDICEENLAFARKQYKDRAVIKIGLIDAEKMPFPDGTFDVIIMHEAIYYLPAPENFINEARRILRDRGMLIVSTVNKDWPDFNPSQFSSRYFSVPELYNLLKDKFSSVDFYGGFFVTADKPKDVLVSSLKKAAVKFHLIPKAMKGKEFLKRLFFGRLYPIPHEVEDGMAEYAAPASIPSDVPDKSHKVIFAIAHKRA